MSITDILFNAAGGGVVGSILHLGTSFFETWQKKKQAEIDIMVMQAKVAAAEKEAAWNAFAASQANDKDVSVPAGVHPIVGNIAALVSSFRAFTRPGLTWVGVALITGMYFSAAPAVQQEMQGEVQFGCWTMLFWWFGSRYSKSR